MRCFHFFVSRSVPDCFQIISRLGGPLFQISRFLDFQKNLERGTGTPFQILATISRFPDCSRFWEQIPTWLWRGDKKEDKPSSYSSLLSSQPLPLTAVAAPVTTAAAAVIDRYPVVVPAAAAVAVIVCWGRRIWGVGEWTLWASSWSLWAAHKLIKLAMKKNRIF
jgi:hypothetical protein